MSSSTLKGRLGWRWAALKNGIQDATAYRIEFLFEVLGSAVVPVATQLVIWYAVFKVSGSTGVNGLSFSDLVSYALVSVLFSQIRGGDQDFEVAEMVRTGGLSNYLLRPVGVLEFIYLRGLGPKLLLSGMCLAVGFVAMALTGHDPFRLFGAMVLALIGNLIHYQISIAITAVAFYWEEAYALLMVKNLVVQLLSGEIIHLGAFPDSWSWLWQYTPFYLYVFGPTQYALGKWTHQELIYHCGIGLLWIMGCSIVIRLIWGLSIRRYNSLGG
jgi:ABC-2 type transport system permease protein